MKLRLIYNSFVVQQIALIYLPNVILLPHIEAN